MHITTTHAPSRWTRAVWLGLGSFFAALTARVLLWDIGSIHDLAPDHLLTIGAMVGAIASGVYFWPMVRTGKALSAVGLGIAFAAATGYCLVGSVGRSDEAAWAKNAQVRDVNADRARAQRSLEEAKRRYDAALDAETEECKSGAGGKCKAKRETTEQRRIDREAAELIVKGLKPAGRENGKLKRVAELISFFRGTDQAVAERGLELVQPFIPPLVCELLAIVFLHLGFAVSRPVPRVPHVELAEPANDSGPAPGFRAPDPGRDRDVIDWVRAFRARNGRDPMIPELQRQFRLPKTTAWRRIKAA